MNYITQPLVSALLLLAGLAITHADPVSLKNPTATFSQTSGWNVSLVTDGTTNDAAGWAIYDFGSGSAVAQTAVFETETNVGFASGSALTFTLYQVNHNPQSTLGRFRLSYTTDDRGTFADGLNSGGDVSANWTVLIPETANATEGATLMVQEDGSVLAGGENPLHSIYSVVAKVYAEGITGFRLEAMEDGSLPFSGPGRYPSNGNFVLSEMTVDAVALPPANPPPDGFAPVALQNPTATLSQSGGWDVSLVTDGTTNDYAGWAVFDTGNDAAGAEISVYETESDVSHPHGSALRFVLYHVNHNPQHTLGRFRLSYTTDARDTFADGLNSGGDVEADWTVLTPESAEATDGAILTIFSDGSILAGGPNPEHSVYTVTARTTAQAITGFRLEALKDDSLPASGPGRYPSNGNFVLTELTVEAAALTELPPPPIAGYNLSADFSASNNPNGVWSYGAKPSLAGPLSVFAVRGLNPFEYWQLIASQEPTIYHNGTSETISIADGDGVFPPGTTFLYSGTDGATNPFGVVRFTASASGNYIVQAAVRPVYDGSSQGDTDFHVVNNGSELYGLFLAPSDHASYSNTVALSAGDTLDFMVGRGQDSSGTASGLKMDVAIVPISTTPPPPTPVSFGLSQDFSPGSNPNGVWSYGAKPGLDGEFSIFGVSGLNPFEYWQLVPSQEPTIYRNSTSETIIIADGQGVFPPGTTFLYSGTDGATNPFGVARFTAPASSNYVVHAAVRPVYDGSSQGDTDFHVVKNGVELYGLFLAPADNASYSNIVSLSEGDTLDFMIGRGKDNSGTTSGLKIDVNIAPTSTPQQPPPVCVPAATGLVAWWALEGDATDAVTGQDGILAGSPTVTGGKVGQALEFDGADDLVRVSAFATLDVGAGDGFTIEGWINPADLSHLRPIAEWNNGAGGIGVLFWVGVQVANPGDGDRNLTGNLVDASGVAHGINTPSGLVLPGVWQHVALTYDKASGEAAIYYNGAVAAQTNLGTFTPLTTGDLYFGNRPSGPFSGIYWKGGMDEMSLYNRALTPAEVQAIQVAATSGKCGLATNEIPPWIVVQPQSQAVIRGNDLSLSVVAAGSQPLRYQWRKGEVDLLDATNTSLAITSINLADAGSYSVVVSNDHGSVTSQSANLVVNLGPTLVRVISAATSAEGVVDLPVELVANGNENAIGFSLNFNPALLNFIGAAVSEGAPEASLILNTNALAQGRLGLALALPSEEVFEEGAQTLLHVTFDTVSALQSVVTPITFGDQPVLRQVSDVGAATLSANFVNGTVSIEVNGLEGDVAPRPEGNGAVTIIDWVQVGRFVAALDEAASPLEFQKADSAPQKSRGNGLISVSDWVQAGRYAAGLDPLRPSGGPTGPKNPLVAASGQFQAAAGRKVMLPSTNALPGTSLSVPVWLESTGNENALAFTLTYDAANLEFIGASKLGNMSAATLNVNANASASGKVGIALALPTGNAMPSGIDQILILNFAVSSSATGVTALGFSDSPVVREVADVTANPLSAEFAGASVAFGPPRQVGPPLTAARSGNSLIFSWPSTSEGFSVYSSHSLDATVWTKVPGTPISIGGQWVMTAPISEARQYFRLEKR